MSTAATAVFAARKKAVGERAEGTAGTSLVALRLLVTGRGVTVIRAGRGIYTGIDGRWGRDGAHERRGGCRGNVPLRGASGRLDVIVSLR
jgi:hypothetical protein